MKGISVADCFAESEQVWNGELEREWPVIQQVAALLIRGPVAADTISALWED